MPESFVTTSQPFGPVTCHRGVTAPAVIDIGPDIHLHLSDAETALRLIDAALEALAILDPGGLEGVVNTMAGSLAGAVAGLVEDQAAALAPAACRDCGATEHQVPLQSVALIGPDGRRDVYQCWSFVNCEKRQAEAAGYALPGGAS